MHGILFFGLPWQTERTISLPQRGRWHGKAVTDEEINVVCIKSLCAGIGKFFAYVAFA